MLNTFVLLSGVTWPMGSAFFLILPVSVAYGHGSTWFDIVHGHGPSDTLVKATEKFTSHCQPKDPSATARAFH